MPDSRGDWVAVAPDASSSATAGAPKIAKPTSAYQYYSKEHGPAIKARVLQETGGKFDLALYGRLMKQSFDDEGDGSKERYVQMARQDAMRYNHEMHQADVAALQRQEQLRKEREGTDVTGAIVENEYGVRTTRKGLQKKQKKLKRKEAKQKKQHADDAEFVDHSDESEQNSWQGSDSDDSDAKKKKPAKKRVLSQKQAERQQEARNAKQEKVAYIQGRQEDLRKEKSAQAKRRLDFLLQQSNIFEHFGNVKEDAAKYGLSTSTTTSTTAKPQPVSTAADSGGSTRRDGNSNNNDEKTNEEDLEDADEHEATFLTSQPSTISFGKMRPYQIEGLNWMVRLQENGVNGILADEMGLGKTLQSISILVYMQEYRNVNGPHLILVPKSTLSNWMNEIARWAPTLKAVRFHGDKSMREAIIRDRLEPAVRDEDRDWHVVVTTYEICNIEKNTLNKFAWSYLIIDEAHRLKNEASSFSKTVRLFETRYRVLLTGTPLQNSLHELWALLNFLVPDVFESAEQFDEWFNLDIDDNDEKNRLISQLHKILRPFMLRRLKADVEKSLPPKHETILFTGMSTMQKKLYRDILIRDIEAVQGTSGNRTAILNIVMQLRKCAGHPYLFPGVEDRTLPPLGEHLVENCGKMVLLDKLLRRLRENGHRVLLFTQMTRVLDIMEDYLVMRRFPYCRIDGNTSYDDRESCIDAYNAPNSEKFLFLLSTRAGGLGINLQTADVVILYDSDWNPQADLQAQDRAHRIGQKRPVQVFRLVTEHTIEEKIVERAQQKLKLDAMVVQQGRLKDKDSKLSRDELLSAVRFGADKIFKSKDSSITDDDIDLILNQGKKKTEEMNEKLKTAEKGDMLDFKFDGGSVQTFEGVDYSNALSQAKAQSEMLGIFDLGKRERKEANYNESNMYQRQLQALKGGEKKPKKKKSIRLPKSLRLPRMEEWQMYDRETLRAIQDEEEAAFKTLPEEVQKQATTKPSEAAEPVNSVEGGDTEQAAPTEPFVLPPLLNEERSAQKAKLLSEGFAGWNRCQYQQFLRSSASYGRTEIEKIALEIGKSEQDVKTFADAFWSDFGKTRIAENEYERAVKFIERGEKKINEVQGLERGTRLLVDLFDNPWEQLEFTHTNIKDKLFNAEEDRFLLCWAKKYGYGHWEAIKFAIRRNPNFRFNYFLRSLPVELLGKRCEQLMKAAEKEVDQIERFLREARGLPVEAEDGKELAPIEIPKFVELQKELQAANNAKNQVIGKELRDKVNEIEADMKRVQDRLRKLNEGIASGVSTKKEKKPAKKEEKVEAEKEDSEEPEIKGGAIGPDGNFLAFPEYDASEPPKEWKKPFTHFCVHTRKGVKQSLDPTERKDKKKINGMLKDRWLALPDDEKDTWRAWCEWDKKRHLHEVSIFNGADENPENQSQKKRKLSVDLSNAPKKKKA